MGKFLAGGVMGYEEVTALGGRVAGMAESLAFAETGATGPAVEAAIEQIQTMASGRNFLTSAMSAYLGPRAGGIAMVASEKLRGAEIGLPVETVLRGYGLKPGTPKAEQFIQAWNVGQIQPTMMAMRYPTGAKGHPRSPRRCWPSYWPVTGTGICCSGPAPDNWNGERADRVLWAVCRKPPKSRWSAMQSKQ
jgi:hypothetical protein